MKLPEEDYNDIAVDFTVRVAEVNESLEEALGHEINAMIQLIDLSVPEQERPIGSLTAYLFNIEGLLEADASLADAYDMRSQHLTDTFEQIYNLKRDEFSPRVLRKAELNDRWAPQWHLHVSSLYLKPEARGRRRGVRALKLLRDYGQRPSLLMTLRAFPEEPDRRTNPSATAIASLARYYISEKSLGFRQLGRLDEGWLVANWSS